MSVGLVINILSLALVILISFIYFSKNRINIFENNIYAMMLKITLAGFIINTFSFIFDIYFTQYLDIRLILIKLYYLYLFTLLALLTTYLFNFTIDGKYRKTIMYFYIAVIILNFLLPLECTVVNNQVIVSGIDLVFTYCIYGGTIVLWIIHLLFNYKKCKDKRKLLPIALYSGFSVPMILVQYFFSNLLLEPFLIAYVLLFMYHTLENPDAKILDELHRSKEISDKANEEKAVFLYNMTQEIRSITNSINDDADFILENKDLDVIYDGARDIKLNTSKFTNITNDIFDVSSIDSGTIKVYNSKYNIKTLLKQIVNIYNDSCKEKGLNFITHIDHDVPEELYGDAIGLKEIINIVLGNSVKYTDKGYVELSVNVVIKKDVCRLIFSIEDSGIGIKSQELNKIKVDNSSLAKANKMITMMNGTLLMSSDYGIGTKVKLILDQKIAVESNTEIEKYEDVFDNISILCVDDSEAGIKIIEKLLRGTKIKIDSANTGKECIGKLKIEKYDLVLLDEDLSQITGIELMKKIKEIRGFSTNVIILTKDTSYEYNNEYINAGFCDYILKPVKRNNLIEKINKYAEKGDK